MITTKEIKAKYKLTVEKKLDTDNWGIITTTTIAKHQALHWGKRRKKIGVGEIKNRRGKRSYFTRFFLPFFPIAEPGLPGYHHHHQHHHHHHQHLHHHHHYCYYLFFFLLLLLFLFFLIIQSQAANCKLPIRSEIYNCRFKNTNIVSIIIIVVIIEFGSCCKFGFSSQHYIIYSSFNFYFSFIALGYLLVCSMCTCYRSNLISG